MEIETKLKTLQEIYSKYSVEGDFGVGDKGTVHAYIPEYEKILAPYRENITFLEVGINQCHSLKMFGEYFINSRVIGADIWEGSKNYITDEKVEVIIGDATKPEFLDLIGDTTFDVILEDASHMLNDQLATYELLKGRMNKGGIYIIEDLINFEVQKPIFESMGFEVIDLRDKKNRYDDAIAIKKF